jgi:hypothetical protein
LGPFQQLDLGQERSIASRAAPDEHENDRREYTTTNHADDDIEKRTH